MHNSDKQILVKTFCRPRHLVSSRGPDWVLSFETTRVQWNCGPTGDVGPHFKQWREGSLGHFVLNVAAAHLGLPCGTASLARERPVAKNLVLQGAPKPASTTLSLETFGIGRSQRLSSSQSGQSEQALRLGNTDLGVLHASPYCL